ncbi:MAG: DUF1588 domain-containing protein [Alphaproteobacteria bacterium]|nr:DUF1588 domain-containing protein [Alphaproteobacteria bacterium]
MVAGLLLALASCGPEAPEDRLDAVTLLTRVSLDVRGRRPSLADLERVREEPEALEALIDAYVHEPGFGEQLAALFAPVYGTLATDFDIADANYAIADEASFVVALGEEPLRMLAEVAEQDLPYPTLFTADWTVIDEHLAAWYPAAYPEGATGWQRAPFTDGRPSAGVLATSGTWWRYLTTDANLNRGRANQISRIFLCRDYLSAPIEVDAELDLLDEEATRDAIRSHPGCVACHSSLDPLGAFFFGFHHTETFSPVDLTSYNHAREGSWRERTDVAPEYYGQPAVDLSDLGDLIAQDPRVVECVVERTWTLLHQRRPELDDQAALIYHREAFLAGDLALRALVRSVLEDPSYQARTDSGVRKVVTPQQLFGQLEDLTGFRFTVEGKDVLRYDRFGLRGLLSGGDTASDVGTAGITPMTALVRERLARAAAGHVAAWDREHPDEARLFTRVDFSETPLLAEEAMRAQIVDLHLRVLGQVVTSDDEAVDRAMALWQEAFALEGSTERAWALVLELLLRHPDFLVY